MSKLRFDVVSLFPEAFKNFFNHGLIKKAFEEKISSIHIHNPRDYAIDNYRKVDDEPYGGGAGMVLKPEPYFSVFDQIPKLNKKRILLMTPQGRKIEGAYHAAGNTILYGATGGQLFIAGTVGQRFGVRNSGAIGVVEGCSAHGAEYMTGGTLVILGNIGFNFAAGMTGGKAIVLKTQKNFEQYISETAPEYKKMSDIDKLELKTLLEVHIEKTNSETAKKILDKFDKWESMFAVFGGIAEVEKDSVQLQPEDVKALD